MKRYRPVVGACAVGGMHRIDYEERADGEFVRYADVLAERERLQGEVDYCVINHGKERVIDPESFPRRARIDKFTPAEKVIFDAVAVVEAAGCDPLLTEAVCLLQQAREKVADFVDKQAPDCRMCAAEREKSRARCLYCAKPLLTSGR